MSQCPRLYGEEEQEMIRRAKAGDQAARDYMVISSLPLVMWAARSFRLYAHDMSDLVQEGSMGILDAIDRYDPALGTFASYAVSWIRQKVLHLRYSRDSIVRLPRNVADSKARVLAVSESLARILGRNPSVEEIGARLPRVPLNIIGQCLRLQGWGIESMDSSQSEDMSTKYDVFPDTGSLRPDLALEAEALVEEVRASLIELRATLENLPGTGENAKSMFRAFYDMDGSFQRRTPSEIAERFGVSRQAVQQAVCRCWTRLERQEISLTQERMDRIQVIIEDLEDLTHHPFAS